MAHEELSEYEALNGKDKKINKRDIFTSKLFQKSLILVVLFSIGQQFSGFNAISFYLQTVLDSTQTSVKSEFASVIIGFIQLLASFGTSFMTDRFGRKPILTVTGLGMTLGMVRIMSYLIRLRMFTFHTEAIYVTQAKYSHNLNN